MRVAKSQISGEITVPGSKSHTIRALFIASLADGLSVIRSPLMSDDTASAIRVCRAFGSDINTNNPQLITVKGFGGNPNVPEDVIDVGNSGTTLRLAASMAALAEGTTVFTGDAQIRNRPMDPLLKSLNDLGAKAYSTRNNGKAPIIIQGKLKGGTTSIDSVTSQYLSSLLITAPLLEEDTEIIVERLNEVPYVEMTLSWLDRQQVEYERDGTRWFKIKGGQSYKSFDTVIPGDFSSATFFAVLAAITRSRIRINNLDINDTQGDKQIFYILKDMGAEVTFEKDSITVQGGDLKGLNIDMNAIPDALPAFAVLGCFAEGETKLLNVPQARIKETDRISVMCKELRKMGADVEELADGLIIRRSALTGSSVNGYGDHRIVMSLAVAGLAAQGITEIDTAESVNVTFPEFPDLIRQCGGNITVCQMGAANEQNFNIDC